MSLLRTAFFCGMQGVSSVGLVILNKYLATYFDYPLLVLICQSLAATCLATLASFAGITGCEMQRWRPSHFVKVVPLALLFATLLYTGFKTMGRISIPTLVMFRNAGPLITAVSEYFLRGEQFSPKSLFALGLMVVGGMLYSADDLSFDTIGYMWAVTNLLCATAAGLWGKHLAMDLKTEQTALGMTCYQNLCSVPIFLFLALGTGETEGWSSLNPKTPETYEPVKLFTYWVCTCFLCVTIGIAGFEFQRLVPQATVVVANVSYKLITLMVGIVIYGNTTGVSGFAGLAIAQGAAILYVYEKQFATKDKTDTAKDADSSQSQPLTTPDPIKPLPTGAEGSS